MLLEVFLKTKMLVWKTINRFHRLYPTRFLLNKTDLRLYEHFLDIINIHYTPQQRDIIIL
jgi:hypothetical protein